jgi:hypothetical protein
MESRAFMYNAVRLGTEACGRERAGCSVVVMKLHDRMSFLSVGS